VNKELIINATSAGVEIALLEEKKLVELHSEKTDARFAVGDLYLGKVKKLIPGLNAAFVDVAPEVYPVCHCRQNTRRTRFRHFSGRTGDHQNR
jgi:Ribonuclease G/E